MSTELTDQENLRLNIQSLIAAKEAAEKDLEKCRAILDRTVKLDGEALEEIAKERDELRAELNERLDDIRIITGLNAKIERLEKELKAARDAACGADNLGACSKAWVTTTPAQTMKTITRQ